MNKQFQILLLLACLSIVLAVAAACAPLATPAPTPPAPDNSITNILWQWTSVANRSTGEKTEVPNPQDYTIAFYEEGTLSSQADCNTFTGTYSQESGFSITLGAMTMAACGENSLDQQYLELLGSIAAGGPDAAAGLAPETAGGEQRMLFVNGGAATQ